MHESHWREAWDLYQRLQDLPEDEREQHLTTSEGIQPQVIEEVRQLLAGGPPSEEIFRLGLTPDETPDIHGPLEQPGMVIGPYTLGDIVGEGGMGAVYRARQERPLRRTVALKLVKPGMDTRQVLARFELERQALAMMDHPHIARVLDAGTAPNGRPYFVMEFVEGVPITRFCDQHRLNIRERLQLFVPICQAIQHAHQKGIIHRDIKPSNILVTEQDGRAIPKVIDFGVAKAVGWEGADTITTQFGSLVGTLEYMSPEQAAFAVKDIDTRTDIYSLGVVLYEVLTGSTPVQREGSERLSLISILDHVRNDEPERPSMRAASQRTPQSTRTSAEIQGEIDWIVMKALEKPRERRYATANGLGRDIQRYLDGEPVEAAPPTRTYRLRKLAARYRVWIATAGAFAAVLVIGAAISVGQAVRATHAERTAISQRDRAVTAEQAATLQRDRALSAEQAAQQERDRALAAEKRVRQQQAVVVAEKHRADEEAATAKAINSFLQEDLLLQAATRRQSFPGERPDPDLKVRTALDRAAARVHSKFEGKPLIEASLENTLANAYQDLGIYPEAARHAGRAYELRRDQLGESHPDTLNAQTNLAIAFRSQGKYPQSETLLSKILEVQRKSIGSADPVTLASMHNLAALYRTMGKYDPAEKLYKEALEGKIRVLGEDHPDTLKTMNNLGHLFMYRSRYPEAEKILQRTISIRQRVLGGEHPDTLVSWMNLGLTYYSWGRNPEAEEVLLRVLNGQMRVLGKEHPDTLSTLNNLANVYNAQGKYSKGGALYSEALAITRKTMGKDNPGALLYMNNLSNSYVGEGRYAEAEALLKETRERQLALMGPNSPETMRTSLNLGVLYQLEGKYKIAEEQLKEIADSRRRLLGDKDQRTLYAQGALADNYIDEGKWQQASELNAYVMDLRRQTLSASHPSLLDSQLQKLRVLLGQGRNTEAESLGRELLDAVVRADGQVGLLTMRWKAVLAQALSRQGKYGEADAMLAPTLDVLERNMGQDAPVPLQVRLDLAAIRLNAGKPKEAEALLVEARKRLEANGSKGWLVYLCQSLLGRALKEQHRFAEAEPLLVAGQRGLEEQRESMPASYRAESEVTSQALASLYRASARK